MNLDHTVTLRAMRFHTHIGVLPHEAEIAQSIEVDLSISVARPEAAQGGEGVVDYRRLYDIVGAVISKGHIRYLEDLVERIAERVLEIEEVSRVIVSVRKPHVALPGPLSFAEVSLDRGRK